MISNEHLGQWYLDASTRELAPLNLWTAPLWIYKGLMLLFALWLAMLLVHWLRWGFGELRKSGSYRRRVPGSAHVTRAATGRFVTRAPGGTADPQRARVS